MPSRHKWIRRLRRLALALVVLGVGGLLVVNILLNVPPLKGKMERMVGGQFGQPAQIGLSSYWPWAGVKLNNVRVGGDEAPMLVTGVRVRVGPLKFLRQWFAGGEVEIAEVECLDPKFLLTLPEPQPQVIQVASNPPIAAPVKVPTPAPAVAVPKIPGAGEVPEGSPPTGVPATTAQTPDTATPKPAPAPPAVAPPVGRSFLLGKVKLSGGEIVIEDRSGGRPIARVGSFEFEFASNGEPGVDLAGEVKVGEVSFLGRRIADTGSAQVTMKPLGIEVREIKLPIEGGEVLGIAKVEAGPGQPFMAEFVAQGIDLKSLAESVIGTVADKAAFEVFAGEGNAKVRLQGFATAPGDVRARISLSANGLRVNLGGEIGKAGMPGGLAIDPEGAVLVSDASAVVDLVRGNLLLTVAGARSGGVWVKSVGRVGRDGGLDLITRLYAAGDLHASFERRSGEAEEGGPSAGFRFFRLPETDWYFHDFRVGGSAGRPLADFWNRGEALPLAELLDELFKEGGKGATELSGVAG
jgi:hypothetical protein